ncbi:MAG TPA: YciI family protein [Acidimicrobiia bacterium]|nr:YciI family protein [Acidimicrobiia bacterium]
MKYVLFYESADDVASKAPEHFLAHKAHLDEYAAAGTLLMVGTFADPQHDGSMSVFSTREGAEEFARTDPFVRNGVVKAWRVLDWNEVLTGP